MKEGPRHALIFFAKFINQGGLSDAGSAGDEKYNFLIWDSHRLVKLHAIGFVKLVFFFFFHSIAKYPNRKSANKSIIFNVKPIRYFIAINLNLVAKLY